VVSPSVFANVTPLGSLVIVEEMLYGQAQEGSLLERIEKVEMDIYGTVQEGAVLMRIDRVLTFLQDSDGDGGLQLLLNLAEWGFSATLSGEKPMIERLDNLELVLYGTGQPGNISKRAERLMLDVWGTTKLDVQQVSLPAQTLVKVALTSTVNSGQAQVGDTVVYKVVEDVMIGGRVVIPVGTTGVATVTEVTAAARLGKDGRVVLDFGRVSSLDGTQIPLKVDETATERNRSLELAAGASMAGIILLGPVGLVGGYFVRGKDVQIEANTQFYVETTRAMPVLGFYFRPALGN
jgi:ribosomal protein L35AE/L33A